MIKVVVILADGCEELEALTPVDVLRRANVTVDTVSIKEKTVRGAHNIAITADKLLEQVNLSDYDAIILPGGMPGAKNISENSTVVGAVKNALTQGKTVGAICASPAIILATHNLLSNYSATCYPAPDFINMIGNNYVCADVFVSKNLITANGPRSALDFSIAICKKLGVTPKF